MAQFGKCNGGGRRRAPRQSAPMIALLTTLSHTYSTNLIDLSQTGVRVSGEQLPDDGAELIFSVENVRAFGCIAWKHDGECGIAFDGPLPMGDVTAIRHKAAKSAGLTPEFRAALDDWTVGLAR